MRHCLRAAKRFAPVISFVLALAPLIGCHDEECLPGLECDCVGGEWDLVCGGKNKSGCNMTCSEGADCRLSCPGGSCNLECNGAASCELECPSGSCNLTCTNTQSCKITKCADHCNLSCGDANECSSVCGFAQSCQTTP